MLTAAAAPAEKLVATAHDAFLRAVDLGSTTAEGRELPPGTIAGACSSEGLIRSYQVWQVWRVGHVNYLRGLWRVLMR